MNSLIGDFKELSVNKENEVIQHIKEDLQAIINTVIKHPETCDCNLIEFPVNLEEEINLEYLSISIKYMDSDGQRYLLDNIPYHLRDIAITYLDYYIECLEESYLYLSS